MLPKALRLVLVPLTWLPGSLTAVGRRTPTWKWHLLTWGLCTDGVQAEDGVSKDSQALGDGDGTEGPRRLTENGARERHVVGRAIAGSSVTPRGPKAPAAFPVAAQEAASFLHCSFKEREGGR